ncbi:hypothetical protein HDV06_001703 [Boothiomyces sp. JEL0866]|nr:hypothetical protein HDV06_001703 [Boothiomyces sp. JEL0866]
MQMLYEIHITIESIPNYREILRRIQNQFALKLTAIELDSGVNPTQVMYSKFQSFDDISGVHSHAQQINEEITELGVNVLRTKLECLASNGPSIAQKEKYFEFHWKLLLKDAEKIKLKKDLSESKLIDRLHLSRNAFKKVDDGEQLYLTLRNYDGGYNEAIQEFDSVTKLLELYTILKYEREYVVYDSNFHLDSGWKSAGVRETV